MPNTPIVLSPAIVTVSPVASKEIASKTVNLESSGAESATRVIDVTSISTPGGGSERPAAGYIYPRGTELAQRQ